MAILNPATMETLGLFRYVVFDLRDTKADVPAATPSSVRADAESTNRAVRGKRRKDTVLICLSQDDVEEGKICMNKG